ncbi:tRNA (adenosine(37)-N6)-threonylcarbamoyltransferase complex transferase subunit TsaD [bacterium]|nr:tRNA (adenosine(37)-N6)-threonylcarbamoyltransferase complex transferase subunit TsaD [candidate division CSSED10-310 bacterium]
MLFLGIETSCDDTAVAIVESGHIVRAGIVANQDDYHRRYGGVVPEIAARKHIEHILPAVQYCLNSASVKPEDLTAVAVTHRPGLIGSLIVGLTAAKCLSLSFDKPLIGINHLEAHAYAACFSGMEYGTGNITLVASGGHTSLLMFSGKTMTLIGRTADDAAGEAYDKVAKLMKLGYPGGPVIDRLARTGDPGKIRFPRPMLDRDNFDFSFSGLKTAVLYHMHKYPHSAPEDIAAAFQDAVTDVLVTKTLSAAGFHRIDTVCIAGGVASNSELRARFNSESRKRNIRVFIPPPQLCTDNAVMVAGLAYRKWTGGCHSSLDLSASADAGLIQTF